MRPWRRTAPRLTNPCWRRLVRSTSRGRRPWPCRKPNKAFEIYNSPLSPRPSGAIPIRLPDLYAFGASIAECLAQHILGARIRIAQSFGHRGGGHIPSRQRIIWQHCRLLLRDNLQQRGYAFRKLIAGISVAFPALALCKCSHSSSSIISPYNQPLSHAIVARRPAA